MEVVNTARIITVKVTKLCLKMPKRYTFFGVTRTNEVARLMYEEIKMANSIFSDSEDSLKLRMQHTEQANCYLQALIGELSLLEELIRENPENYNKDEKKHNYEKDMVEIMELIKTEVGLISGYKKYIKEKMKKS